MQHNRYVGLPPSFVIRAAPVLEWTLVAVLADNGSNSTMRETTDQSYTPRSHDHTVAVDSRLYRLLEINQQIDILRGEHEQILQSLLPEAKPELCFDDHRRRIHWGGGLIKLGKKSYLFVKTIWFGENHQAELTELEENVWTQHWETETFVDRCTVSMLVRHVQKNLNEANFPYEIEAVKNFFSRELEGFRLILRHDKKKTLQSDGTESV